MLRAAPALTLALFLLPIGAGLVGTLLPAFGYFPAIGGTALGLEPWRALFATPGILTSLRLTVVAGLLATLLSLAFAVGFCALGQGRRWFDRAQRLLAPLLATPHAAMAIGFAFLIIPSGWIARMLSPWLTGWTRPPGDLVTVQDPWGLAFALGLVLKETPYLVLMIVAATGQVPARAMQAAASGMGYRRATAWMKIVFPLIYTQIRLPVYAVLAFSLSVVEVAAILAPGQPPPLAVLAARWFADYDLRFYYPGAAAAVLQLLLVGAAILGWRGAELVVTALGRRWAEGGGRAGLAEPGLALAAGGAGIAGAAGLLALVAMAIWSFAAAWRFPDLVPAAWTLATWTAQAGRVLPPAVATVAIAVGACVVALALALACLENEQRRGLSFGGGALWLLYLPLLVPQIAFLFGAQVTLVRLGLDGTFLAVGWVHLLFVLPYLFLSLADPYRALDPRLARSAAALGAGPARIFWAVKLPLLLRPVLTALAVGFAVSVGQYLPTLFAGAGRIATLTTEAVTLAGGADRRIIGVYAFLQSALPLLVYGAALGLPRLLWRNRRGMQA